MKLKLTELSIPMKLEETVSLFIDRVCILSKTYTIFKMLQFARKKGLQVEKTPTEPAQIATVMHVKIVLESLERYLKDVTIYKMKHTINNLCRQVARDYETEFIAFLND